MPPCETEKLPFFCDEKGEVIWIPGCDVADNYRVYDADRSSTVELYYFTDRKAKMKNDNV